MNGEISNHQALGLNCETLTTWPFHRINNMVFFLVFFNWPPWPPVLGGFRPEERPEHLRLIRASGAGHWTSQERPCLTQPPLLTVRVQCPTGRVRLRKRALAGTCLQVRLPRSPPGSGRAHVCRVVDGVHTTPAHARAGAPYSRNRHASISRSRTGLTW